MSSSGSLSGITFGGLSSGLDTNSIIARLMQIEQIPITREQQRVSELQQKQQVYSQLGSLMTQLSTAASSLNTPTTFNATTSNSSDTTVATLAVTSNSNPGIYNLSVTNLAQTQKISSGAQADTTSALNLAGTFVIGGKAITVKSSDSLISIAANINSAGSGVTASVIDGGAGKAYLTLTSGSSGVANKVQLGDLSGGVLSSLGLVNGAAAVRETITNGATSFAYKNSTSTLASLWNGSGLAAGTIQVNGTNITIDPNTDTLQTIANSINASASGATATVRTVTDSSGAVTYKLDISGASTPTFTDDKGILAGLGIVQQSYGTELVKAQDATYTLDGLALTSSSNTITTAIPGATLTLLKGTVATPGTSTLSISSDPSAVKAKIHAFADAYNAVEDFITQNSQFDKTSFQSGPLLGDSVASTVDSSLQGLLFNNVPGLTGNYTNLTTIGFGLDSSGKITIDDSVLGNALGSNATAITKLFEAAATATTSDISYVTSTSKSKASGASSYAVNITQLATQGSYTGEQAQTTASTQAETLTFNGALFANTPYQLTLDVGSTAATAVSKINNDARLRNLVVASLDNTGKLQIVSKRYGVNGNFTAVSNISANTDNSGLGVGSLGTVVSGVDVAGTINGETATGNGQFLTGAAGNATTDGLQIQYSGTTLGAVGSMTFTKGMGSLFNDMLNGLTDSVNGIFKINDDSLQGQIDAMNADIATLTDQLSVTKAALTLKYANMETAISQLQAQSNSIGQITGIGGSNK